MLPLLFGPLVSYLITPLMFLLFGLVFVEEELGMIVDSSSMKKLKPKVTSFPRKQGEGLWVCCCQSGEAGKCRTAKWSPKAVCWSQCPFWVGVYDGNWTAFQSKTCHDTSIDRRKDAEQTGWKAAHHEAPADACENEATEGTEDTEAEDEEQAWKDWKGLIPQNPQTLQTIMWINVNHAIQRWCHGGATDATWTGSRRS